MSKPAEQFVGPTEDYACSVCFEVPYPATAVETTCCGRFLCENCLISIQKTIQPRCPSCRQQLDHHNRSVSQDSKFVWRQMQALEVYCEHIAKGSDCRWTGPWANLQAHLLVCKFGRVPCRWAENGCVDTFPKNQVENHSSVCEFRPFACQFCKAASLWKDSQKHIAECQEHPVVCDNNCGTRITRKNAVQHKEVCPREMVRCIVAGCPVKIMRQTQDKHQLDAIVKHNLIFSQKINELEGKIESLLRDNSTLSTKNSKLEKELDKFKPTLWHANTLQHGPFRIRIEPFRVSPECHFKCCDVEWYAYLRQDDQKFCLALWPKEFLNKATGLIVAWEGRIFCNSSKDKAIRMPPGDYEITTEQIQGYLVNLSEDELLSSEWCSDGKLSIEFDNISVKQWMW